MRIVLPLACLTLPAACADGPAVQPNPSAAPPVRVAGLEQPVDVSIDR